MGTFFSLVPIKLMMTFNTYNWVYNLSKKHHIPRDKGLPLAEVLQALTKQVLNNNVNPLFIWG